MLAIAERQAGPAADDALLRRIRAEFREMPGLCLTVPQARRLWALQDSACEAVLARLLHDGFLRFTADGSFVRADVS